MYLYLLKFTYRIIEYYRILIEYIGCNKTCRCISLHYLNDLYLLIYGLEAFSNDDQKQSKYTLEIKTNDHKKR